MRLKLLILALFTAFTASAQTSQKISDASQNAIFNGMVTVNRALVLPVNDTGLVSAYFLAPYWAGARKEGALGWAGLNLYVYRAGSWRCLTCTGSGGTGGTADGNNYVTGVTFNAATGIFTISRDGLGNLPVNLDGRYALLSHTHGISSITGLLDSLVALNLRIAAASGGSGSVTWDNVTGKPSTFTPAAHTQAISTITGLTDSLTAKVNKVTGKGLSTEDYSTAEKNKLAGIAAGATVNSTDAALRDRSTHTGTQAISTVTGLPDSLAVHNAALAARVPTTRTITVNGNTQPLSGDISFSIATGSGAPDSSIYATVKRLRDSLTQVRADMATANTQDRARANHTGTQSASTISDFGTAVQTVGDARYLQTFTETDPVYTAAASGLATKAGAETLSNKTLASPAITGTPTGLTKVHVGLSNVDNTSDAGKPVSTAQQAALDLKAPLASPAFTGTVTGISKSMVGLGSVDNTSDAAKPISTATQAALDLKAPLASPTFTGTVSGVTKSMVGLGSVDNTSDAAKPISTATQTALDLKAPLASPTFTGTVGGVTKAMVGLGNVQNVDQTNAANLTSGTLPSSRIAGTATDGYVPKLVSGVLTYSPDLTGSGSGITSLTGDVTASGTGAVAATLASTAVTPGSYSNANITVDAKGRITAASNGSSGGGTSSWTLLTKSSDQVNSTTTITGISSLTFPVTAGRTYHVRGSIIMSAPTSPGGSLGVNTSNTIFASPNYGLILARTQTTTPLVQISPGMSTVSNHVSNQLFAVSMFFVANASGTFELSCAAGTSVSVTVKAGSFLEYYEIP